MLKNKFPNLFFLIKSFFYFHLSIFELKTKVYEILIFKIENKRNGV